MRFLDALVSAKKSDRNVVIPDIKCFSPKEGELMKGRNPVDYALTLCAAGAPVLSVVTEEKEFHGSLSMLRTIAEAVEVPILRKDFIHTVKDLEETVEAGASAILLMCSCLEKEELKMLYKEALRLGLDPFVETHKKEDFELVRELDAKLVGINNRNILVLERDNGDVNNTLKLASLAPEDAFLVSESSIRNQYEVHKALQSGADAALVGTAILTAKYTESFYRMLTRKRSVKICGFMNEQDIELGVKEGADRIGLVVEYPLEVPWNLTAERAADLRKCIPSGHQACIVAGGTVEEILSLVDSVKPDAVQLHFHETKQDMERLIPVLHEKGICVIKTIPMKQEDRFQFFGTNTLEETVQLLCDLGVDELLVDPRQGNDVQCRTLSANIEMMQVVQQTSSVRVILAGGLTAENLADRLAETNADAVDIMNGSEDKPGQKNPDKLHRIFAQV